MSIERFGNDLFRADREMSGIAHLSISQLICGAIFVGAVCSYIVFNSNKKNKS